MRASNRAKGRRPLPPISVPLTPQEAYGSASASLNGAPRQVAIPPSQDDANSAEAATEEQVASINILSYDLLLKVFEQLSLRSRINAERGTCYAFALCSCFLPSFSFTRIYTSLLLLYSVQTLAFPAPSKLEVRWQVITD